MNTTKDDSPGAVAGQVDCRVRPRAWLCEWPTGKGGGGFMTVEKRAAENYMRNMMTMDGPMLVPLYDLPTLQAAVAAERERCAEICERMEWPGRHHSAYIDGQNDMADKCAAAIRGGLTPEFMQAQADEAPRLDLGA